MNEKTEVELAVGMWCDIRENLDNIRDLADYKSKWCKKHGVLWRGDCYLCEKYKKNCRKCPLGSCLTMDDYSTYNRISLYCSKRIGSERNALADCNEIISILLMEKHKEKKERNL